MDKKKLDREIWRILNLLGVLLELWLLWKIPIAALKVWRETPVIYPIPLLLTLTVEIGTIGRFPLGALPGGRNIKRTEKDNNNTRFNE